MARRRPHRAIHQRGACQSGTLDKHRRGDRRRSAELARCAAGSRGFVSPEDDLGIEERDQRREVAAAGRSQEGFDDLTLTSEVGVGNSGRALDPPTRATGQLASRGRRATDQNAAAPPILVTGGAGTSKGDEDKARSLVRAASRAGARHLVYISVVGADRIPVASGIDRALFGYFGSKFAAERVVGTSDLPWTTLRATQSTT